MIYVTNIRNANTTYDQNWAIVRSLKSTSSLLTQVTDLAPSSNLFHKFLQMKDNKNWNRDTFNTIYVPQFIKELRENDNARQKFEYLWNLDKSGANISLVCFCTDETMCHRSIIAGILSGGGCNVKTDTNNNYSQYFNMYRSS